MRDLLNSLKILIIFKKVKSYRASRHFEADNCPGLCATILFMESTGIINWKERVAFIEYLNNGPFLRQTIYFDGAGRETRDWRDFVWPPYDQEVRDRFIDETINTIVGMEINLKK